MDQDLTSNSRLKSVNELMASVQEDIDNINSGAIDPIKARLILRGRTLQFKGVELFLQAARIEQKLRPQLMQRIGGLIEKPKEGA